MKLNPFKAKTLAAALLLLVLLVPSIMFAQSSGQTPGERFGLDAAVQGTGVIQKKAPDVVGQIIFNVLTIVGVLFLVLIVWGGVMWMVSGGNEKSIGRAKQILITATVGLVIIVLGYTITFYIVEALYTTQTQSGATTISS